MWLLLMATCFRKVDPKKSIEPILHDNKKLDANNNISIHGLPKNNIENYHSEWGFL